MDKPILALNNVSIIQDDKQVLTEVNIEITSGEFVYIIGEVCWSLRYCNTRSTRARTAASTT